MTAKYMLGEMTANGWLLLCANELEHNKTAARVAPFVAAANVDRWCADSQAWPSMHLLYEKASGSYLRPPTTADVEERIKPFLRRAFERGLLVALEPGPISASTEERDRGVHFAHSPIEAPPKDIPRVLRIIPEKEPEPDLTFIEIALVDDDGNPVPHHAYEVTLSNGEVRTGTLDGEGKARIEGIPEGNCLVRFPSVDGREWAHKDSQSSD